jgi:hypothetical protein
MTGLYTIVVIVVVLQPQMSCFTITVDIESMMLRPCGVDKLPASSTVRMLMACCMTLKNTMVIWSSMSLELDEDIVCVC